MKLYVLDRIMEQKLLLDTFLIVLCGASLVSGTSGESKKMYMYVEKLLKVTTINNEQF